MISLVWRINARSDKVGGEPSSRPGLGERPVAEGTKLKPAQERALEALGGGQFQELTRARYEELTGVSRSQAAYDLADLVDAEILVRIGAGRATRYRLARETQTERRRWTGERIRAELTDFCAGREQWPSAQDFRRAGRSGLYVAASRYGGIGFWAAEMGFSRPARMATAEAHGHKRAPFGRRAAIVAAVAIVAAAGAAAIVAGLRTSTAPQRAQARAAARSLVPIADEAAWARRAAAPASTRAASARPRSAALLVLRGRRGASWVSVRSAHGRLLYEGTLQRGRTLNVRGRSLWVRLGRAYNLVARVNGGRARGFPANAALVVVTAHGIRVIVRTSSRRPRQLVGRAVTPTRSRAVSSPASANPAATSPTQSSTRPSTPTRTSASARPIPLPAPPASSTPAPLPPP